MSCSLMKALKCSNSRDLTHPPIQSSSMKLTLSVIKLVSGYSVQSAGAKHNLQLRAHVTLCSVKVWVWVCVPHQVSEPPLATFQLCIIPHPSFIPMIWTRVERSSQVYKSGVMRTFGESPAVLRDQQVPLTLNTIWEKSFFKCKLALEQKQFVLP